MAFYKHLKERSYYEDLYDRRTVDLCRFHQKDAKKDVEIFRTNRSVIKMTSNLADYHLMLIQGERFRQRNGAINEWMDRDRKFDQMYADAESPKDVRCTFCSVPMKLFDKDLNWYGEESPHVSFSFICENCRCGADIANGKRTDDIPWQCPECKARMKQDTERTKRKITTFSKCDCGYSKTDVLDLDDVGKSLKKKSVDPEEERRYEEDKLKYCMGSAEGAEYLNFQSFLDQIRYAISRPNPPEPAKVQEYSLTQLKKLLTEGLTQNAFTIVSFGRPALEGEVSLLLTVTDEKERTDFTAKKELRKVLNGLFTGTNWGFVNSTLKYKLGVLKVKLRSQSQTFL